MKPVQEEILKILRDAQFLLTIEEISQKAGITRQTTSKYLFYLEGRGMVKRRDVGAAKLFYISEGRAFSETRRAISYEKSRGRAVA